MEEKGSNFDKNGDKNDDKNEEINFPSLLMDEKNKMVEQKNMNVC